MLLSRTLLHRLHRSPTLSLSLCLSTSFINLNTSSSILIWLYPSPPSVNPLLSLLLSTDHWAISRSRDVYETRWLESAEEEKGVTVLQISRMLICIPLSGEKKSPQPAKVYILVLSGKNLRNMNWVDLFILPLQSTWRCKKERCLSLPGQYHRYKQVLWIRILPLFTSTGTQTLVENTPSMIQYKQLRYSHVVSMSWPCYLATSWPLTILQIHIIASQ